VVISLLVYGWATTSNVIDFDGKRSVAVAPNGVGSIGSAGGGRGKAVEG
jgi:hypothetical protein